MTGEPGNNDELIEYIKKFQPVKIGSANIKPDDIISLIREYEAAKDDFGNINIKREDEYFVFTLTAAQRQKLIAAIIKIIVAVILILSGYFLPHSQ